MSLWKDFVTAGLLGTEKGLSPKLPSSLTPALEGSVNLGREQQFLTQAGAFGLWRMTGAKLSLDESAVVAAEKDDLPTISGPGTSHLRVMLSGSNSDLLPEWLAVAVRSKRRVPPELLPGLLEHSRKADSIRSLAIAAGGQRAIWLASHNPNWSFAASEDPDVWETGSRDQRVSLLRTVRTSSPSEAREKIEAVWKEEPADVRTAFVRELAVNISDDDISFLEAALEDRSKEVRREVINLLAALPRSPFVTRMIARATPLLSFNKGKLLSRASIEVTLPDAPDAAALRDGMNPKDYANQRDLGDKAVCLVLIIAAVPLQHWTETFKAAPDALLKAVKKSEFASAVTTGWAWAAARQRNAEWAAALMEEGAEVNPHFITSKALYGVLPEQALIDRIRTILQGNAAQSGDAATWQDLHAQLASLEGEWPMPLARDALAALRRVYANESVPWHLNGLLHLLALRAPPSLLPEAVTGWPDNPYGVPAMLEALSFRHAALEALSQS